MKKSKYILIGLLLSAQQNDTLYAKGEAVVIANCTDYNWSGYIINNSGAENFSLKGAHTSANGGCINCLPNNPFINFKFGFSADLKDQNNKTIGSVTLDTENFPLTYTPSTFLGSNDIYIDQVSFDCGQGENNNPYKLWGYVFRSLSKPMSSCGHSISCFPDGWLKQYPNVFGTQAIPRGHKPGKK